MDGCGWLREDTEEEDQNQLLLVDILPREAEFVSQPSSRHLLEPSFSLAHRDELSGANK